MDLALSGRAVSGQEAEGMGLVARCVEDDELLSEASHLAQQIAAKSSLAVMAIKRRLRKVAGESLDEALDAERDAQAEGGPAAHRGAGLGPLRSLCNTIAIETRWRFVSSREGTRRPSR